MMLPPRPPMSLLSHRLQPWWIMVLKRSSINLHGRVSFSPSWWKVVCNAPTKTIGSPCDIYLAHDIHGTVEWWALLHLKESGARYCCQMLKLWKMSSQQCQSGPNRQIGWVAQISLLIFMVSGGLQKCFVKDLSDKCLILKCAFWMLIYYLVTLKPW